MTVLQVIALNPFKLGSFEEYIMSFAKETSALGHRVVFVFSGEPHPLIKKTLSQYKSTYYVEKIPENAFGHAALLYRLVRLIQRSKADIVQGQFHPFDHLAVLAALITGRPAYRTIHTTTNQSSQPLKLSSVLKAKISSFFSRSTFAVSEAVKKDLIENLRIPKSKIQVLYNGVNLEKYSPRKNDFSIHKELGIGEKAKIVLCIAHARPSKGLEYLIGAAPIIIKNQDNVHFVFCGGGPLESDMIELSEKLGVSGNVHFLGVRNDIQSLINCSYVLVMPSLAEAFGLVLIESMAMQRVVIASNVEGITEIVENGETGLLVQPADSNALSEAIINLLESPKLAQAMGTKGRKRVEDLFDLKKRVLHEIKIYEELAGVSSESELKNSS